MTTTASTRFTSAVDDYFAARRPQKDSANTLAAYRNDLTVVGTIVATQTGTPKSDLTVDMLTLPVIRAAFAEYAEHRAKTTIRRCWSTWQGFFNHLVAEGALDGNPMAGVARPNAPRHLPKAFTPDNTQRILTGLAHGVRSGRDPWPERDLAVIFTLLVTGLRTQELLDLNIGDLTGPPGGRLLRVRGKGDADRSVPIENMLETVVGDYLDSRRARFPKQASRRTLPDNPQPADRFSTTAALFVDRQGDRLRRGGLQYLVRCAYRAAGVDSVRERGALVHALRHTFATRLIENPDTSVIHLMDLMGHKSLTTTQRYLYAASREVRATAARNPVYEALDNQPNR